MADEAPTKTRRAPRQPATKTVYVQSPQFAHPVATQAPAGSAAPAEASAPARRRPRRRGGKGGRSHGGASDSLMIAAYAGGGAVGVGSFLRGKTLGPVPQSGVAGAAAIHFSDDPRVKDAGKGAVGFAIAEYMILDAIEKNTLGDFLKPYLDTCEAKGGDSKTRALAYRASLGISSASPTAGSVDADWENIASRHANS